MKTIEFTNEEIEKLSSLIKELNSFYDYDEEFDNHTEEWNFEDVNAQREIACEMAQILEDKIVYEIADESVAFEVLKVAEEKVKYNKIERICE